MFLNVKFCFTAGDHVPVIVLQPGPTETSGKCFSSATAGLCCLTHLAQLKEAFLANPLTNIIFM